MNCDLSPLSATNSAKQLERSKKMENAEQEFVSVVREYERVIYKVCYLYTTPNATLNDLYQEVVLNLWKAFPKFRRECKISTWIYRIALNTCISFIRKEKNIPEIVTLNQEADRTEPIKRTFSSDYPQNRCLKSKYCERWSNKDAKKAQLPIQVRLLLHRPNSTTI